MINEIQYVNIREVMSRALRHPLVLNLDLETTIQHTIDFIGIVGLPKFYISKEVTLDIEDFRSPLPCDLISIELVKHNGRAIRAMTDVFHTRQQPLPKCGCILRNIGEETFKTLSNILYTSFKHGKVELSYKAIPVDCEGLPLLPDNALFLKALEEYIIMELLNLKFQRGKLDIKILLLQERRYAWRVALVQSEFTIPSVSEMEAITRMWNTLIPRVTEFTKSFRDLGNREYLRNH